jgi:hypothetical protein
MLLGDLAFPVTRGQLDVWLAREASHSAAEWQVGLFVKIESRVERDPLNWAIRRVVREAEPARAAFFEVDAQVFQRAIDYPHVELAFYDLSSSRDPVQEAHGAALPIQRTPMLFAGPLFKLVLFRTRVDEFYFFACGHHIFIDGSRLALVGHRLATVYSAIVSGAPIPRAFFGSVQDLVECESEYEAPDDYPEGEKQILKEVLSFASADIPNQDVSLSDEQVEELVRGRGAVGFPRHNRFLNLVIQNINCIIPLYRARAAGVSDGDMITFCAMRDEGDRSSFLQQSWRPYVARDITVHSIYCTYQEMLTTESLSMYGKQLRQLLGREPM